MIENISLILQVHQKLSVKEAKKEGMLALDALNLSKIAHYRYTSCSSQEKFCTQLIRATMLKNAKIILDQPFRLLDEQINIDFILSAIQKLNIEVQGVQILDLIPMQTYYEGSQCLIKKH